MEFVLYEMFLIKQEQDEKLVFFVPNVEKNSLL